MNKEIFIGVYWELSKKRDMLNGYISINDGFYNIDSERITYKIVKGDKFEVKRNMEKVGKVCVPGINCYTIILKGEIIIPDFLVCDHEWINNEPGYYEKKYGSNYSILYEHLRWAEDIGINDSMQRCIKCQRHRPNIKNKNITESRISVYAKDLYENIYDNNLEDCHYEILNKILYEFSKIFIEWLEMYLLVNDMKLIGLGLPISIFKYPISINYIRNRIWQDLDGYPSIFKTINKTGDYIADSFSRKASKLIGFNNLLRLEIGNSNIVEVDSNIITFCGLTDYQNYLFEFPTAIDEICRFSRLLINKKIIFIGSTPQGGGVALMRHAHMRFYKLLGLDVQWYVTIPVAKVYNITKKKFHNVLQGVENNEITDEEIEIYENWIKINYERFWKDTFKNADIIVLDDHQTSGLTKYIKEVNKNCKIIYRSHIQIKSDLWKKDGAFTKVWKFISNNLKCVDYFISHPKKEFVPKNIDPSKVIYFPPSTDPLDGLNKELTRNVMNYYKEKFDEICRKYSQPLIDDSPYIIQIARFDPSKGIKDTIDSFIKLCNRLKSEHPDPKSPIYNLKLIITGHGSVDDPQALTIYNQTVDYIRKTNCKQIICVQIPPCDQILNFLLRNAKVALQLSISEGFEIKVTEAILKNVPVIVYETGGLPIQVSQGLTGYVVKVGDIEQVVNHLEYLLKTPEFYQNMKKYIKHSKIYTTPFQILGWLHIFDKALKNENGNEEFIYEKIREIYFK